MSGPTSRFLAPSQGTPVPTYQGQTPEAPVSTGDVVSASSLLAHQDMIGSQGTEEWDAYKPIVAQLDALDDRPTLTRLLQGPRYMHPAALFNPVDTDAVWSEIARQRAANPDFMKDVKAGNAGEFSSLVQSQQLGQRQAAQSVLSRKAGVVQDVASFGTGVAVGFTDPVNLAGMIATGGGGAVRTLAQGVAREALVNGAITAAQQPFAIANRSRFGEDTTAGDVITDIAEGAAGGALFHAGIHGAGALGAHVAATSVGQAVTGAVNDAIGGVTRAAAPVALRFADLAGANDNDVAAALRKAVPAESRTPDQQAGLHVVDRQADIDGSNPFEPTPAGQQAHADRLGDAITGILNRGDPATASTAGVTSALAPAPAIGTPGGNPAPDLSPDRVIRFVMGPLEGGARVVHYGDVDGGTTKFGIAAKFNPGVDVANLSADGAAAIARRKYWLHEYDHADPRTAAVAFDAGYIAGPDEGRRILQQSGGDPARALELYRGYLDNLADTNPAKAKYRAGWNNRLDKLQRFVGGSEDRAVLRPEGFPDGDALDLAQHDLDRADIDQQMLDQEARAAPSVDPVQPQTDAPTVAMEASAAYPDVQTTQDPAVAAAQGAAPSEVQPMAASRPPSIVAPDAPIPVRPETRVALRDYASDRGNSLAVDKVATALGIQPAEARGALEMLAARADGTIVQRGNGSFTRRAIRRAPVDLNRFLSDRGGLRDTEGHDLVGGRNLQKFVPASGMLIRKGGMTLDGAREAAAEAGYFHQHGSPDEAIAHTTTADFLDLLEHAHDTPHFALGDLGEADRLAENKKLATERRGIGDVIDARLGEHGFEFDRSQQRRAADLVQQNGFTHEQAIIHTINEEFADVIDGSRVEAEKDQYERAAHDAESAYAGDDRRGALRDDGSGSDARDPGEGGQGAEELQRADRGGDAAGDEREANGLAGPPPLHDPNIERFSDPAGEGARVVAASIEHDVRALTIPTDETAGRQSSLLEEIDRKKGATRVQIVDDMIDRLERSIADDVNFGGVSPVDMAYDRQRLSDLRTIHASAAALDIKRQNESTARAMLSMARDKLRDDVTRGSVNPDEAQRRIRAAQESGNREDATEILLGEHQGDPAVLERERQHAQLKAEAPMRSRADQDSTIGSPLFDAVDQQQFRLDDNGADRSAADILKEIDGDEAAIKAARNCL